MTENRFILRALIEHYADDDITLVIREGQPFSFFGPEDEEADPVPQTVLDRAAVLETEDKRRFIPPISDRQFFHGLTLWGLIPEDQAMQAVKTGDIPEALARIIDGAEQAGMFPPGMRRFDIDIIVAGATSYDFNHMIAKMIGQALGWDENQRQAFWEFAAQL